MSINPPPRLIRDRCGVYYFRLLVPLVLRQSVGKNGISAQFKNQRFSNRSAARSGAVRCCGGSHGRVKSNIADFSHLFGDDLPVRKVMTIDLDRGKSSRQFGVYLDTPEVQIVDELKVFHSFRHTVITKLADAGVNEGLKGNMVGHLIRCCCEKNCPTQGKKIQVGSSQKK